MNRFGTALATLLSLLAIPAGAHAQDARALQASLVDSNWAQAHQAYQSTPYQASVPLLREMAAGNHTMAQWFLADALAQLGQDKEATLWLYTASLGTRMDASICKGKRAGLVEYRFLEAFLPRFDRLRANDAHRREALMGALSHHKQHPSTANPTWVCQMVAHELRRPPSRPFINQTEWATVRQRVMIDYQRQTGLNFSRSPDLIDLTPLPAK